MKNTTPGLFAVILNSLFCFHVSAQTHVSGGIWANTTWTLANSPYIVDSSVVVLPGFILTIEPGVVVKFEDGMGLEIRQAQLIAIGTATGYITFTSNNVSPAPGIYSGILLNGGTMYSQVEYCNFFYAYRAISCGALVNVVKHCRAMYNYDGIFGTGNVDSCLIKYNTHTGVLGFDSVSNSTFVSNYDGMFQCFHIDNCIVDSSSDIGITMNNGPVTNSFIRYGNIGISKGNPVTIYNCVITNNQRGIELNVNLTMTYCTIDSNVIGIYNHPGIASNQHNYIANCHVEYNATGIDIWINNGFAGNGNVFTENNIDHNDIGISMYQVVAEDTFYCNTICNNTSYGFKIVGLANTGCVVHNYWCTADSASTEAVIYDVYDNLSCGFVYFMPIDSLCSPITAISENETTRQDLSFIISPNPAVSQFEIRSNASIIKSIEIYNMLGEKIYSAVVNGSPAEIDCKHFPRGIYFVHVSDEPKMVRKLVVE